MGFWGFGVLGFWGDWRHSSGHWAHSDFDHFGTFGTLVLPNMLRVPMWSKSECAQYAQCSQNLNVPNMPNVAKV